MRTLHSIIWIMILTGTLHARPVQEWIIQENVIINDDTTSGYFQKFPAIAVNDSGHSVIVWEDPRDGALAIYAQRIDASGQKQGPNIRVNDDIGIADQSIPDVAMDNAGNFIVVWEDERNSGSDIYAQHFDSTGAAVGTNFCVTDDHQATREHPSVDMNGVGAFIIVWSDDCENNSNIYGKRYDPEGNPLADHFRLNDLNPSVEHRMPDVALDDSGGFVIVWSDDRNTDEDVFMRYFDEEGCPIGSDQRVNDDIGNDLQGDPAVAYLDTGHIAIVWTDGREDAGDIYLQIYDRYGILQGTNTKVNADPGIFEQGHPAVSSDNAGTCLVVWEDSRNTDWDIYLQRFVLETGFSGGNLQFNTDIGTADQILPAIGMTADGHTFVVWQDYRNYDSDVYIQRFMTGGTFLDENERVNDDSGTAFQQAPDITMDGLNGTFTAWEDDREHVFDIYAQRLDHARHPFGLNFRVNDNEKPRHQRSPRVAGDGNGKALVVWRYDTDGGGMLIRGQLYDANGQVSGANFDITDSPGVSARNAPVADMNSGGRFVVVWRDHDGFGYSIYCRVYDVSGNPLGEPFQATDNTGHYDQQNPDVAMDMLGNFIVVWEENRNGAFDIYARSFDAMGLPACDTWRLNDDIGDRYQGYPRIDLDDLGVGMAVWRDNRNGNADVYAQRLQTGGYLFNTNFCVNADSSTIGQYRPTIAVAGSGASVVVWTDYRDGLFQPRIMGQRFNADGAIWGQNTELVLDSTTFTQMSPAVSANENQIVIVWQDARRSKGWDVYANYLTWDWDGSTSVEPTGVGLPGTFHLEPNFPNPFNAETMITYGIPGSNQNLLATLTIYNILGKKVRTLVHHSHRSGTYHVSWDGTNDSGIPVKSGVYLVRLEAQQNATTRRMHLIK